MKHTYKMTAGTEGLIPSEVFNAKDTSEINIKVDTQRMREH